MKFIEVKVEDLDLEELYIQLQSPYARIVIPKHA